MKDLMIDLETLGTKNDCVILSLGACFFDIEKQKIGKTFYMCFEIEEQKLKGRTVDAATLAWWNNQSNSARKVFTEKKHNVFTVLNNFEQFIYNENTISQIMPWGNGSTFDISILEHIMEQYNVKVPWLFYNVMDLRTFKRFKANDVKVPKVDGINHHALDDAINQANYVMKYGRVK